MIKNVVFDVGMVLADFRYREYMTDLGFDKETIEELSEKVVFSEYWKLMDNGLVNDKEAKAHFISELPQYERQMNLFWDNIDNIIREYDYSEGLVRELKAKGLKVYVLSNYPETQADMHWPKFRFLPLTDGYLISSKDVEDGGWELVSNDLEKGSEQKALEAEVVQREDDEAGSGILQITRKEIRSGSY